MGHMVAHCSLDSKHSLQPNQTSAPLSRSRALHCLHRGVLPVKPFLDGPWLVLIPTSRLSLRLRIYYSTTITGKGFIAAGDRRGESQLGYFGKLGPEMSFDLV